MTERPRILIFHTAFAGDIILTLPVAQTLRAAWPDAYIAFVAIPGVAAVLRNHPAVDEVLEYDKKGTDSGLSGFLRLRRRLSALHCTTALAPHRSLRSALAVWCARIPRRVGFSTSAGSMLFTDIVPYTRDAHEIERNLTLLTPLDIAVPGRVLPRLYPSAEDVRVVDQRLGERFGDGQRPMIALAPGSVWATKRWPEEHYRDLAHSLVREGVRVVLVGGAEDEALCTRIARGCGEVDGVLNAAGGLDLLQSAELLRRCRLVVSNDSAPMHLAVGVGTPVFALFGATVPGFGFGPLGRDDRVFEIHGLSCRPCGIHGGDRCPIGTFVCMRNLNAADLHTAIVGFLSQHHGEG